MAQDYASEFDLISRLRQQGWAIAAFTPEEVGKADSSTVEDMMVERGWYAIEDTIEIAEEKD